MSDKVLVVDDKQMMRDSVGATLQRAGFAVVAAGDGNAAMKLLGRHRPAAVITDLKMPEMDGLELLKRLRQAEDQLPVVLMTAYGSINDAVAAMKQGAFDFIQKPFEGDQLVMVMRRAVEHRRLMDENAALKTQVAGEGGGPVLIGNSPAMQAVVRQVKQIAQSHASVLIAGESGTGKEVVARMLHAHSLRQNRMMLCLNCAALSSNLLESELFGHERGAFTGADQLRKGRFELADGGTLLLDEISEISPELQAKLLRVLQEGQFERVGSSLSMEVDVRVVATTNRDLARSIAVGEFRQDLYYRLNVLPIHLPPLRERLSDVPSLAEHFLTRMALREGREPKRFDDEAIGLMQQYAWPGNVRELQNVCERASVLSRERVIQAGLIQPWLLGGPSIRSQKTEDRRQETGGEAAGAFPEVERAGTAYAGSSVPVGVASGAMAPRRDTSGAFKVPGTSGGGVRKLEELEREQIIRTLGHFAGNRHRTAEALGIGVRTLGLKLKKWKELELVAQSL